jgi:hypothetical protein
MAETPAVGTPEVVEANPDEHYPYECWDAFVLPATVWSDATWTWDDKKGNGIIISLSL